jgi:hypothetical protein
LLGNLAAETIDILGKSDDSASLLVKCDDSSENYLVGVLDVGAGNQRPTHEEIAGDRHVTIGPV